MEKHVVYSAIVKANEQANTELFGHEESASQHEGRMTFSDHVLASFMGTAIMVAVFALTLTILKGC